MSIELDREEIALAQAKLKANQKRYAYDKSRGVYQPRFKPAIANKLKGYYDDYVQTCSQNLLPVVELNEFIAQYCIYGWLEARSKLKGK